MRCNVHKHFGTLFHKLESIDVNTCMLCRTNYGSVHIIHTNSTIKV